MKFQMFKLVYKRQRNQRSNCQHPVDQQKSKRVLGKHLFLLYWLYQSLCVHHHKLWKILKELGIPDHPTCLLRNLYVYKKATVRIEHGTTDWFQIGKGVPGSSPGGSREFEARTELASWKELFNYRYEARLEKGSVVGNISGEKRLNNLVYAENQ